jgi:hypothetical protein
VVGVGGIVSVGGGASGSGGGGSGIQSLNGATGPAVVLVGVSGIDILPQGNTIFIGGDAVTGGGGTQSGVLGVNGIVVEQVDGSFVVDGATLSGLIQDNGCFAGNFAGITSGQFVHSLGTRDLVVQVFDDNLPPRSLVPDAIIYDTLDVFSVLFNRPQTGSVVAMACGGSAAVGTSNRVEIDLGFKAAFGNGDTYSEIIRNLDGRISGIFIWETDTKLSHLFTKTLTRISGQLSQVSVTDHIAMSTLITNLGRDGSGRVSTVTKVYTP